MELISIIEKLRKQREELNRLIASLEHLQAASKRTREKKRRGRISMDAAERLQVSERMKKYWAMRRSVNRTGTEYPLSEEPGPDPTFPPRK